MATTVYNRNRSRIAGLSSLAAQKIALRPNDLNVSFWLKGDGILYSSGTTPCNDGDGVATWTDASPYAYGLTQGISGKRPLYKTNIINGFPIVRFDGTDDILGGQPEQHYGAWFTLMIVVTPSSTTPLGIFDSAPNAANTFRNYNSGQWEWQNAQPQFNLSLANTNTVLLEFTAELFYGANNRIVKYYRNGALISTNTGTRNGIAWANPAIGGINGGTAGYFTGDMAELLLFSRILTNDDRQAMERYLMTKWAITG